MLQASHCTVTEVLDLVQAGGLNRQEIQGWMRRIRRETVALAIASGKLSAHAFALGFLAVYRLVWLKSWILPSCRDLRLLVGGELFVLCQVEGG